MRKSLLVFLAVLGVAGFAFADSISFTGQGTNPQSGELEANAVFEIVGSQLIITLANTGPAAEVPSDLLSGVFFDLANANLLTPVSAMLVNGAQVIQNGAPFVQPAGYELLPDVGTEFAFLGDLSGSAFRGAQYGIEASGLGYFGPGDRFDTSKPDDVLSPPASPDGANFGLASAISGTANSKVTGVPVIVGGSVQFVFGYEGSLSLSDISNVNFQYGTSTSDPNLIVPEPSTIALMGIGIAGLAAARRVRKNRA